MGTANAIGTKVGAIHLILWKTSSLEVLLFFLRYALLFYAPKHAQALRVFFEKETIASANAKTTNVSEG